MSNENLLQNTEAPERRGFPVQSGYRSILRFGLVRAADHPWAVAGECGLIFQQ